MPKRTPRFLPFFFSPCQLNRRGLPRAVRDIVLLYGGIVTLVCWIGSFNVPSLLLFIYPSYTNCRIAIDFLPTEQVFGGRWTARGVGMVDIEDVLNRRELAS